MKYLNAVKLFVVTSLMSAVPAFAAAPAQPDTEDATTYLLAGVATLGLIFAPKFVIAGVKYLGGVIKGVIGR